MFLHKNIILSHQCVLPQNSIRQSKEVVIVTFSAIGNLKKNIPKQAMYKMGELDQIIEKFKIQSVHKCRR